MINILLNGCNGKMGQNIAQCARFRNDLAIVAGLDISPNESAPFPVYNYTSDIKEKIDLIVYFSHPNSLNSIIGYALEKTSHCHSHHRFSEEQKIGLKRLLLKYLSSFLPICRLV